LEVLSEADVPSEIKERVMADYEARRKSVHLLREHLRLAVETGKAEVYSCWIGDEEADPEMRLDVTLDHFGGDFFHLSEKQFLKVWSASGD
jgi:hypothetical protein